MTKRPVGRPPKRADSGVTLARRLLVAEATAQGGSYEAQVLAAAEAVSVAPGTAEKILAQVRAEGLAVEPRVTVTMVSDLDVINETIARRRAAVVAAHDAAIATKKLGRSACLNRAAAALLAQHGGMPEGATREQAAVIVKRMRAEAKQLIEAAGNEARSTRVLSFSLRQRP